MKVFSVFMCKTMLAVMLCFWIFWSCGCGAQLGETRAEGSRRHKRVLRVNSQQLMADIDKALLLDKPSKLTDKRIP